MVMSLKFLLCDPNTEVLLGVRMKKGRVYEVVGDCAFPTGESEYKISFGFLLFQILFIFKNEKIQ